MGSYRCQAQKSMIHCVRSKRFQFVRAQVKQSAIMPGSGESEE